MLAETEIFSRWVGTVVYRLSFSTFQAFESINFLYGGGMLIYLSTTRRSYVTTYFPSESLNLYIPLIIWLTHGSFPMVPPSTYGQEFWQSWPCYCSYPLFFTFKVEEMQKDCHCICSCFHNNQSIFWYMCYSLLVRWKPKTPVDDLCANATTFSITGKLSGTGLHKEDDVQTCLLIERVYPT